MLKLDGICGNLSKFVCATFAPKKAIIFSLSFGAEYFLC